MLKLVLDGQVENILPVLDWLKENNDPRYEPLYLTVGEYVDKSNDITD